MKNQSGQDPLNFPIKTNNRLASLLRVVGTGEGRPIGNVEPIFEDLQKELKAETDRLRKSARHLPAAIQHAGAADRDGADFGKVDTAPDALTVYLSGPTLTCRLPRRVWAHRNPISSRARSIC